MPTIMPGEVNKYLLKLNDAARIGLENLCDTIRKSAPEAIEGKSYGLPAFIYKGKALATFGASKNHLSYYPMSPAIIESYIHELEKFEISKGTVKFTPEHPLPSKLIEKMIKARMHEIDGV